MPEALKLDYEKIESYNVTFYFYLYIQLLFFFF